MVKDQDGKFYDIQPVDQQTRGTDSLGFVDGQNEEGEPTKYDKTANGIFLDKIPSYNSTGGLKIFINRETTYFTASDTTKKPGFAGLYHEYLAVYPAWQYAQANGLANQNALFQNVLMLEKSIEEHYSKRADDERDLLEPEPIEYL